MANSTKTTRDHDEIRRWAEERGGKPAHVKSTESSEDVGILRIDFPGYSGEGSLEEISWDEFFEKFDARNLAFLYQEETAGGERSNFNKLVSADTVAEGGAPRKRARPARKAAKKRPAVKKASAGTPAGATAKKGAAAAKKGAKKVAVKKAAPKKAAPKKAAKKAPVKKASAKKASPKKAAPKKAAYKMVVPKKATKKVGTKKRR
jgi:hypothetical protein